MDLILLYGYADESVRPSVRHNSVNLMWHIGNQWSPPSNNFWTYPTPDRAQRYYAMYVSTWTAHSSGARAVSTTCSLYMHSSSATISWNKCRWRSYWWHLGDASTTYTRSASAARRTAATSGSSDSRLEQLFLWWRAKLGVSELQNPWTDCHKIWHEWILNTQTLDSIAKNVKRLLRKRTSLYYISRSWLSWAYYRQAQETKL